MNGKGSLIVVVGGILLSIAMLAACSSGSSRGSGSYSSGGRSNSSSNYSSGTTRNGYDMPKSDESLSDYIKRVDPGLYSDMQDIYNSANGK